MRKLPQFRSVVKTLPLIALLIFSCEKTEPKTEQAEPAPKQEKETAKTGKFAIGEIKIAASQSVFKTEGLLDDKAVLKCITDTISKSDGFAESGRKVSGTVTYDIQSKDQAWALAMFGVIAEKGEDGASVEAGTQLRSNDVLVEGKTKGEASRILCERFAKKVAMQFEISVADDQKLTAVLADAEVDPDVKVKAIHEIREKQLKDAAPVLVSMLENENVEIAVAAAAALAVFDHEPARAKALALAERLSRDKNPQYIPMLHILADLGGDPNRAYLETVSKDHAAEGIRVIAGEALKKMR